MANKKQTAVDFIEKSLNRRNYRHFVNHREIIIVSVTTVQSILEQAKEMEKEQIKIDYDTGYKNGEDDWGEGSGKTSEQYYNETYGCKND